MNQRPSPPPPPTFAIIIVLVIAALVGELIVGFNHRHGYTQQHGIGAGTSQQANVEVQ